MIKKIDHIGIAVKSIDEQIPYYRDVLGLEIENIENIESEGVKVCFIRAGDVHIELLEPVRDDSPVKKFLDAKGQGFHHIAFESDDISGMMEKMKANNVQLLSDKPKQGAGGKLICFAHPKSTFSVLTEICQKI
jgi:methylmalonyl-CoA epimerase